MTVKQLVCRSDLSPYMFRIVFFKKLFYTHTKTMNGFAALY